MIFITGDTHGEFNRFSSKNWKKGRDLTKDDYMVILGDFGLFWENPPTGAQKYFQKWFHEKPWTTLFIDGNHENFDLVNSLPETEMFGGTVGVAGESIFHLKRGEIYNINGNSILTLGGATSTDKAYRREGRSWWPEESISGEDFEMTKRRLEEVDWSIDYVFTHTIPSRFLPEFGIENMTDQNSLTLEFILSKLKYLKHWYCGHMHENRTFGNYRKEALVSTVYQRILPLGSHFGD